MDMKLCRFLSCEGHWSPGRGGGTLADGWMTTTMYEFWIFRKLEYTKKQGDTDKAREHQIFACTNSDHKGVASIIPYPLYLFLFTLA